MCAFKCKTLFAFTVGNVDVTDDLDEDDNDDDEDVDVDVDDASNCDDECCSFASSWVTCLRSLFFLSSIRLTFASRKTDIEMAVAWS